MDRHSGLEVCHLIVSTLGCSVLAQYFKYFQISVDHMQYDDFILCWYHRQPYWHKFTSVTACNFEDSCVRYWQDAICAGLLYVLLTAGHRFCSGIIGEAGWKHSSIGSQV